MKRLDKDTEICSYKVTIGDDHKTFSVILGVDYPLQYNIGYDSNHIRRRPWWRLEEFDVRCKHYIEDLGLDKEVLEMLYKVLEVEGIHIKDDGSVSIDDSTKPLSYFEKHFGKAESVDKLYKMLTGCSIPDNVIDISIELGSQWGHLYDSKDNTLKAVGSATIVEEVVDESGHNKKISLRTDFDKEDSFIRNIIAKYGTVIDWNQLNK